ncbi:MAG TPA: CHRD domain-containing protein [Rubricoccaceae bacterium]|nr:CHRD domain-containing protein [Rubricoccaceae bacterium]
MKRLPFLLALSLALPLVAGCDEQLVGPDPAAGTLATETASSLPPILDRGGRPLSARLNGENEVPGPGDPDGTGSAFVTLNHGQREVCFALTVADIEPATAAHIHVGPEGVAGPIVVPLDPPTDGTSRGCVADVERDLIRAMLRNPEGYYVNVHNAEYPAGAIRGQLRK